MGDSNQERLSRTKWEDGRGKTKGYPCQKVLVLVQCVCGACFDAGGRTYHWTSRKAVMCNSGSCNYKCSTKTSNHTISSYKVRSLGEFPATKRFDSKSLHG